MLAILKQATPTPTMASFTTNVRALNYKNPAIVDRLVNEEGLGRREAEELFEDTLKFLALTDNGVKLSPAARIDLGWHNFILHTVDYAQFCEDAFGHFIHHVPGSGLTHQGLMLSVQETANLALSVYGDISSNWVATRDGTCGSGGC